MTYAKNGSVTDAMHAEREARDLAAKGLVRVGSFIVRAGAPEAPQQQRRAPAPTTTAPRTATAMPIYNLTTAQRCEARWHADVNLRAEFGGGAEGLKRYIAYEEAIAGGHVRVLGAPRSEPQSAPGLTIEETARIRYRESPAIRQQFGTVETYIGWCKASAAGLARVQGGRAA